MHEVVQSLFGPLCNLTGCSGGDEVNPKDKVAVITGGASVIRRTSAFRFLEEGESVLVADKNPASGNDMLARAAAQSHSDHLRFVAADVSSEQKSRQ